jgi:hypothetical protein
MTLYTWHKQQMHQPRSSNTFIHFCFLLPSVTGHYDKDPMLIKELKEGDGQWAIHKEILGWMFDVAPPAAWSYPPRKWRASGWSSIA